MWGYVRVAAATPAYGFLRCFRWFYVPFTFVEILTGGCRVYVGCVLSPRRLAVSTVSQGNKSIILFHKGGCHQSPRAGIEPPRVAVPPTAADFCNDS